MVNSTQVEWLPFSILTPAQSRRLWKKIDVVGKTRYDCWEWTASLNDYGYGQFRAGEKVSVAHKFVYEELIGPVEEGMVLDHLCRNRKCCNPFHLDQVSIGENTERGTRHGVEIAIPFRTEETEFIAA